MVADRDDVREDLVVPGPGQHAALDPVAGEVVGLQHVEQHDVVARPALDRRLAGAGQVAVDGDRDLDPVVPAAGGHIGPRARLQPGVGGDGQLDRVVARPAAHHQDRVHGVGGLRADVERDPVVAVPAVDRRADLRRPVRGGHRRRDVGTDPVVPVAAVRRDGQLHIDDVLQLPAGQQREPVVAVAAGLLGADHERLQAGRRRAQVVDQPVVAGSAEEHRQVEKARELVVAREPADPLALRPRQQPVVRTRPDDGARPPEPIHADSPPAAAAIIPRSGRRRATGGSAPPSARRTRSPASCPAPRPPPPAPSRRPSSSRACRARC